MELDERIEKMKRLTAENQKKMSPKALQESLTTAAHQFALNKNGVLKKMPSDASHLIRAHYEPFKKYAVEGTTP